MPIPLVSACRHAVIERLTPFEEVTAATVLDASVLPIGMMTIPDRPGFEVGAMSPRDGATGAA